MHCSPPLWHSCNHFTVAMVYIIRQYFKSADTKVLLFFFLLLFFLFLFLLFLQSTPEIGRSWVPWGRLPCLSTAWSRVVFAVLSAVFILRLGPMEWRCPDVPSASNGNWLGHCAVVSLSLVATVCCVWRVQKQSPFHLSKVDFQDIDTKHLKILKWSYKWSSMPVIWPV